MPCIPLFSTFLCLHCTYVSLSSPFLEDVNKRWRNFLSLSILNLDIVSKEFNCRRVCLHLKTWFGIIANLTSPSSDLEVPLNQGDRKTEKFKINHAGLFCYTSCLCIKKRNLKKKLKCRHPWSMQRGAVKLDGRGSLGNDVFERSTSTESGIFCTLRPWLEQIVGQIICLRVKTLEIQIWWRQGILKKKKAHFRFTCVAQKRHRLN